jgi:hypothetical protein
MGTYASGRRREKRATLEECQSRSARDFGEITHRMPTGEAFTVGKCPQCGKGCRTVYRAPNAAQWQCRRCCIAEGIQYRTVNERNSAAAKVRADPQAIRNATAAATVWLQNGEDGDYNDAMKTLSNVPDDAALDALDSVQVEIIRDDLTSLSRLMNHVATLIYSGVENHTNRRGESSEIPLRADSLSKLGNLYIAASAARANRAGIATKIHETRPRSDESGNMRDILKAAMNESGWRAQTGHTMEEIEEIQNGTYVEPNGFLQLPQSTEREN